MISSKVGDYQQDDDDGSDERPDEAVLGAQPATIQQRATTCIYTITIILRYSQSDEPVSTLDRLEVEL